MVLYFGDGFESTKEAAMSSKALNAVRKCRGVENQIIRKPGGSI